MNGRTILLMLIAIGCGLGAMFGTQRLLNRRDQAEPVREILVAARDLQVEEVLSASLIKVEKRPAKSVPVGSFSSFKDVDERWVKIPILAGEPIIEAKLAERGTPMGLLPRIGKGKRAFSLEVNEEIGVAGFIQPDHHVDVVLARSNRTNVPGASHSETILQDVPVLASGQATSRADDKAVQVRTVTLALSPDQVEAVVAARAEGELSLSLRGFQDHTVIEKPAPPPPPAPELAEAEPPPAPAPEPAPAPVKPPRRTIVVFRGLVATNSRSNPERIPVGPHDEVEGSLGNPFGDPEPPDSHSTPDPGAPSLTFAGAPGL